MILTFSHVVLRGWRDLGIPVTADEEKAYLHCWNVIGHVLGIEDRFLARDPADARELFEAIKRRRSADTRDGRLLTRALLDYIEGFSPAPQFVFRPIGRILMYTLLAPETCAQLGVRGLKWMERIARVGLLWLVRIVNGFYGPLFQDAPGTGGRAALLAKAMLNELVSVERGGNRPPFRIPDRLAEQWRVAQAAPQRSPD